MADEVVVEQPEVDEQAAYVAARLAGQEITETPVEKPAAEEPEAEKPEEKVAEEPKEEPKSRNGAQKKIDRLIKEKADLERRLEALERNAKPKEETKEAPKAKDGEPKLDDYADYEEYLIAKAEYRIETKQKAAKEAAERQSDEAKAKKVYDAFQERAAAAKVKYEDFDDVVNIRTPWPEENPTKEDIAASQAFHLALVEEESSAEIMYYLGQHPDELAKMGGLSPAQVVKAVGRLADKLSVTETEQDKPEEQEEVAEEKPKRVPPTPIKPLNTGSSRTSVPLHKIDDQRAYVAARRAGRTR